MHLSSLSLSIYIYIYMICWRAMPGMQTVPRPGGDHTGLRTHLPPSRVIHIYIYIHTYMYVFCVYMCIYIYIYIHIVCMCI